MTPAIRDLLTAIRDKEAGRRGYDAMYGPAEAELGQHRLTDMTLGDIFALQKRMVKVSASSACGGYQFLRKTLASICNELALQAEDRFSPALQDRMAMHLLERRGLSRFLAGRISREQFANQLAMEWASLPVVTRVQGQKRIVEPGETYYAGDGLNEALHDPAHILALLDAVKAEAGQPPSPPDVPIPDPDLDMRRPKGEPSGAGLAVGIIIAVAITGFAALKILGWL